MSIVDVNGEAVEFPDGMTDEQIASVLRKQSRQQRPGMLERASNAARTLASSVTDKGGIGNALVGAGEGALQMATGAASTALGGLGAIAQTALGNERPGDSVAKVQQALTYQPRTPAGQATGELASLPFEALSKGIHAAGNAVRGDAPGGGARDALATTMEVAAEVAPALIGPYKMGRAPASAAAPTVARTQQFAKARAEGYTVNPVEIREGGLAQKLAGAHAGDAKLNAGASISNAEVRTAKAKRDLGLPEDEILSPQVYEQVRERAGKPYEAIKAVATPFRPSVHMSRALQSLESAQKTTQKSFKRTLENTKLDDLVLDLREEIGKGALNPESTVEAWKLLSREGNDNLASAESKIRALGRQQRQVANALHRDMEINLIRQGKGDLADSIKDAKVQIAKSYDYQRATIGEEVSGTRLAQRLKDQEARGRSPMSGAMREMAEFARDFPGSNKNTQGLRRNEIGKLDLAGAVMSPKLTALALTRGLPRKYLLSDVYQNQLAAGTPNTLAQIMPSTAGPAFAAELANARGQ